MRILTLLLATVMLACEPTTEANLVEPEAGSADLDGETMTAQAVRASDTERCGVPLDAVTPHGDSLPKLWPATLTVEESDTVRFRIAPQPGTLDGVARVRARSRANWSDDCRRNNWECGGRTPGVNPLYSPWLRPHPARMAWAGYTFNDGDYSAKTVEFVLTNYLRDVPLGGRQCGKGRKHHCVGEGTARQIRLDVDFRASVGETTNAYGCQVIVNIVPDGSAAAAPEFTMSDPEFTVFHDPGPTIAIYRTYQPQSEDQRRRFEEAIKWLTAYGVQWDTLRGGQLSINYFAGTGDATAITPRFFLHDPYETRGWWEPKPRVNNGGLRWLKGIVPSLGVEARRVRERFEQVKVLLHGRVYVSHEHHLARLDNAGSGTEMYNEVGGYNWVTAQEMVDDPISPASPARGCRAFSSAIPPTRLGPTVECAG